MSKSKDFNCFIRIYSPGPSLCNGISNTLLVALSESNALPGADSTSPIVLRNVQEVRLGVMGPGAQFQLLSISIAVLENAD